MMMSHHHPRRMLPPGNNRKRKLAAEEDKSAAPKAAEPITSNQLLAGYLAHEFLTKGTLSGQKFEPDSARAEGDGSAGSNSAEPKSELSRQGVRKEHESYGEVASIMKTDGTHIKGIVNPTQLSRWIHM